jgi:hypothetical protein
VKLIESVQYALQFALGIAEPVHRPDSLDFPAKVLQDFLSETIATDILVTDLATYRAIASSYGFQR